MFAHVQQIVGRSTLHMESQGSPCTFLAHLVLESINILVVT